jgi:hypothetical protein
MTYVQFIGKAFVQVASCTCMSAKQYHITGLCAHQTRVRPTSAGRTARSFCGRQVVSRLSSLQTQTNFLTSLVIVNHGRA